MLWWKCFLTQCHHHSTLNHRVTMDLPLSKPHETNTPLINDLVLISKDFPNQPPKLKYKGELPTLLLRGFDMIYPMAEVNISPCGNMSLA